MNITPEQARFATRLFQTKGIPQSEIARLFKVDVPTIRQIIRAKSGDHMDDVNLSDSQKRIMKIVTAHAQKLVQEEFAKQDPDIRRKLDEITPHVEATIREQLERVERALSKADQHEGMMM